MKENTYNVILLIIRIVVGGIIAWAGYMKLVDMDTTINSFNASYGLSAATTWTVAIAELLAGLAVLLGVWTRIASIVATVLMVGAVYYTGGTDTSSWLLLLGSIVLLALGGGEWGVIHDKLFYKEDSMSSSNISRM